MTATGLLVSSRRRRVLPPGVLPLGAGLGLLCVLWTGALPDLSSFGIGEASFSAHMIRHMGIVAVASPLLAIGLVRMLPALPGLIPPGFALAASFTEFAAVWGWHAPALHEAARASLPLLLAEQGSFLAAGLSLWLGAVGSAGAPGLAARAGGVGALLFTSMHMTLLGALLLLAPRPLYLAGALCTPAAGTTPLADQALGGTVMLLLGGAAYLAGGLTLLGTILARSTPAGESGVFPGETVAFAGEAVAFAGEWEGPRP